MARETKEICVELDIENVNQTKCSKMDWNGIVGKAFKKMDRRDI